MNTEKRGCFMSTDEITNLITKLKQIESQSADVKESPDILSHLIGEKVLIRDNMAGIFITTLKKINGRQWVGGESRKIHYWEKAGAVEGIAQTGIDLNKSRVTVKTPMSAGKDLVQICVVDKDVFDSIMGAPVWNPK